MFVVFVKSVEIYLVKRAVQIVKVEILPAL